MNVPRSDVDLFADDVLADPYPHLRALRDAGPIVWLDAHELYAVPRYAEARAVLDDDATFVSGEGVGLNDFINTGGRGTALMSDGAEHACQREIIGRPLTPRSLAGLRPDALALAARLVDRLVAERTFDAVPDLAEVLPATWVPDLLGWPADGREHLLDWGAASFDGLGPLNDRAVAAGDGILGMTAYAQQLASSDLPDGSFAARILAAAERGEVDRSRCPMMIIDYLAPSLDTTISALGNAVWLLATHPDQWALLRREPHRVRKALDEALRLESPISCFTRVARHDAVVGGVEVPAGSRVLVSFASANRDERRWDDPERFDITRESAGHLAFGHGEHACVGMGLARLEATAVLTALVERVATIELAGPPRRKPNNLIRAFASLPVTLTPAGPSQDGAVDGSDAGGPTLRPIGRVVSELVDPATAPRQGDEGAPDAWVELRDDLAGAVARLPIGADVLLLTWLDRADREVLFVHPRGDPDRPVESVFLTRSPDRPNPIGLHRVRVLEVDGARVRVGGLEALDGTPVVDIKPVLGPVDER